MNPSTSIATSIPSAGDAPTTSRSLAARIAGASYVAIFLLAIFANFGVREGLIVSDDAAATVANLTDSLGLFRWGLIAFLVVFLLDVVAAWALHVLFRDVHRDVSLLAAWFRLTYTVFLGMALVFFFRALQLVTGAEYLAGIGQGTPEADVMLALESFNHTWLVGLAAFGIHLVLLGFLVVRSGLVMRLLGTLLVVAGAAYVIDTVAHAVLADYAGVAGIMLALVALPSMIGEGWLGLWLLVRAPRRLEA